MTKILIVFFSISISWTSYAKTLVIADIDDTLRVTNRLYASYTEQLSNIADMDMPFSGMKELMVSLDQSGAKIYYLTAAVQPLTEFGEDFLEENHFPQDHRFVFKMWWEETEAYKVKNIRELIQKESPDTVILIGDNGEKDSAAYGRIQAEFANTHVYIHWLYKGGSSATIPESQVAYITAAEIVADLEHNQVYTSTQGREVMTKVLSDLVSGQQLAQYLVLPYWSDITADDVRLLFSKPYVVEPETQSVFDNIGRELLKLK